MARATAAVPDPGSVAPQRPPTAEPPAVPPAPPRYQAVIGDRGSGARETGREASAAPVAATGAESRPEPEAVAPSVAPCAADTVRAVPPSEAAAPDRSIDESSCAVSDAGSDSGELRTIA